MPELPGDLGAGLPWYDGKIIYKSGDAAVPMAIAVTEEDAATIVTALAAGPAGQRDCLHMLAPGEKSYRRPSFYCEAPAVALVEGCGPRCLHHLAKMTGATILPVDYHPDLWAATRRLIAASMLSGVGQRERWVNSCIDDLAAMRLGYVSRIKDEEMPAESLARADMQGGSK